MSHENKSVVFDIIIIGAGTAGSLLASRLSTNLSLKILVLEAGENRNDDANVRIPGLSRKTQGNPTYDWQFQTLPEEELHQRVIQQPRGKLWGGSSAINSHALVYPSKGYHDAWAELSENGEDEKTQWNWEGVKEYYRKFQSLQEPSEDVRKELGIWPQAKRNDHHEGLSEGIQASFPITMHVLQKAWADTIENLGLNNLNDPLNGKTLGGAITTNAIDAVKSERSHAGVVFLEPAAKRESLVIRSNVMVEKILFDANQKHEKLVATGVLYSLENGEIVSVRAQKEVILCAGTFGSPKILELSGVGNRESLAAVSIECLYDLPGVGGKLSFRCSEFNRV
jgi:choline dehydrogenase-like flavoprotein